MTHCIKFRDRCNHRGRLLLVNVLFVAQMAAMAQDAALIPANRNDLLTANNDTMRADALARICYNFIVSEPDSSLLYGERALALATRIGNVRALADAHNNLGWLDTQQGRYKKAEVHFRKALDGFDQIDNPAYTSVTLSNMGWWCEAQGDRVGALKYFQDALNRSEQAKDTASTSILLYSIGTTYSKMKEYQRAREHIQRSLELEGALDRKQKQASCLLGIGNTYRYEGDTANTMRYYEMARGAYTGTNDHIGIGMVSENSGDLLVEKEPEKALAYYREAYAHYDSVGSPMDQAYALLRMGIVRTGLRKFNEALSDLDTARKLATRIGSMELVMDVEEALAELAVKRGQADEGLVHFKRYMSLKDSLQGADNQRELARLRTVFETEKAEQENLILKSENELRKANEERLRNRGVVALAAAVGLVGLLLLVLRNYRLRGKHTAQVESFNKELADQRDTVQHMNSLLELKVLRSQLNPHFIYNCQSSAIAMMKEGRSAEALSYLQGFARLLRMILEHSVKDRIGIDEEAEFLRQYLKLEAIRLEGLKYEVNVDPQLLEEDAQLPALLVQPFVENAVWHGLAEKKGDRNISIRFSAANDELHCTVCDNGVGRHSQNSRLDGHQSLGTELTNERLQLLTHRLQQKGSFRIDDLVDANGSATGTRVTLTLTL